MGKRASKGCSDVLFGQHTLSQYDSAGKGKWRLATVFLLTVAVYAAGLVLPIFTQHAVDSIAAGSVLLGLQRGFAGELSSPDAISITMIHARCARGSESSTRIRFCLRARFARISPQGSHEPMTLASIGHWRLRARKVSSGSYQAGSRPSLRRTAAIYPADSASGWQSHGPSSATPTLGCSMSPPLFSMQKLRWYSKSGLLPGGGSALDTCHASPGRGPQRRRDPSARSRPTGRARVTCDIAAPVQPIRCPVVGLCALIGRRTSPGGPFGLARNDLVGAAGAPVGFMVSGK
jgi:hypothetical protein